MKRNIIILAITTLILSSCGIYTKYQPETIIPEDPFGAAETVPDTVHNIANLNWRQLFVDPHPQSLIEQGLRNNTGLQSAHWRVEEACALLNVARLAYLPSFVFSSQSAVSSFDEGKAGQSYPLPITSSWEIDILGRLTNANRRARALYIQSQEYELTVRTQLIVSPANTHYTLLMLDAQLTVSEETEVKWKESVRVMQVLKNAGQSNEAGLTQTEAIYYSTCTTVLDLKEQIRQTKNSLCLMLGETPQFIRRGTLDGQILSQDLSVGVPLQLLTNRPDVRSSELVLARAFYTTNEARSAFYPSITLSGSAGWTNGVGEVVINPGKLLPSAVGSLTQSLFNKGQNIARLGMAKTQQEETKLSFTQILLNAGAEVNNTLKQSQTARDESSLYQRQIPSLQTAVASTQLLMQHGNSTYLEVLTAQQTLLTAQLTQVSNRFQEIQGIINLYQVLGGGREE